MFDNWTPKKVIEILVGLGLAVVLGIWLFGCGSGSAAAPTAAEGLDLHALVGVVRAASNGEDLEQRLNTAGSINNLDLDNDGKVDFLDVTEFGEGEFRGYSLAVHFDATNTQEVAEIKIHASAAEFTVQVKGNEQIYGGQSYVVSHIPRAQAGAAPFLLWAFAPRPVYVHPVVIGVRPAWYHAPVVVPVTQYRTVTKTVTRTIQVEKPKVESVTTPATVANPNAGKVAQEAIKAPLAKPTVTQQQFQARPENKAVATGGFGANKAPKEAVAPVSPVRPPVANQNTVKEFKPRDTSKPVATGGFGTSPKPAPAPAPPPKK